MPNITLAWRNRTDEATLTGGSWLAGLPLNNLKNRQVQKVARSADALAASTKFVTDFGQARSVGVVALIVHNIGAAGQVRICANSANNFAAPIYDSGWLDAWPAGVIPLDTLEWEDDNFWLGTMTQEQRAGYQSPFIHLLPAQQNLRYWQIEISDATNPAGYVQIGRLFMSQTWTSEFNYSYGSGLGYEDPTPIEVSLSEAEYFDVRSRSRLFQFNLDWLSSTEAYSNVLELQRLAGTSGEVLAIPDSSDAANFLRRSYVGRLKSLGQIKHDARGKYSAGFELKELL